MERDSSGTLSFPLSHSSQSTTGCAEFTRFPHSVTSDNGHQTVKLKTVNSKLYFKNPLKLVVTKNPCANCQWLYHNVTSGGVQSAGNCVSLDIGVGENCNVVLTTPEYSKISASSNGSVTKQEIRGRVADRGLLAVVPDLVLCYRNASYQQQQVYHLTSGANLVLLDWVMAGRIALGEVWEMTRFASENKVFVDGKLVYGDAISLGDLGNDGRNHCSFKESLQHTKVLGSFVFIGPLFTELKWTIKNKVNEITDGETDGVAAYASVLSQPFCDGVVVKLLAAQTTEQARLFFRRLIEGITVWIGSDPLDR